MSLRLKLVNWLIPKRLIPPEELLIWFRASQDLQEPYADLDRYRDFKAVFESPAGKRVLRQILQWAHIWQSSMNENAMKVMFSEGERNLGLKILATLSYEPIKRIERQNK